MEATEREEAEVMKREESDARERQIAIREEQVEKEMQRVEIEKQVLESQKQKVEREKEEIERQKVEIQKEKERIERDKVEGEREEVEEARRCEDKRGEKRRREDDAEMKEKVDRLFKMEEERKKAQQIAKRGGSKLRKDTERKYNHMSEVIQMTSLQMSYFHQIDNKHPRVHSYLSTCFSQETLQPLQKDITSEDAEIFSAENKVR